MELTNIEYERKHNESYMIIDANLDSKSYETKMIKSNEIRALLDMTSVSINGVDKLSYKISRMENLEDFVESRDLDAENLSRLIINIKIALDEISKYLIDENHILLNKETIFLEKGGDSYQVNLCYLPKNSGSIQEQFREVMEYFITKLTISDREISKQIYAAYEICLKEDYTLDEVIDCLQQIKCEKPQIYVEKVSLDDDDVDNSAVYDATQESEYITDYLEMDANEDNRREGPFEKLRNLFSKLRFEDIDTEKASEDFVFDPDYELEEKTVLLTETKPVGRLVYDGNNNEDDFIITKDIFKIGTAKNNDAVLKAKTVSGNHAKITKEGNDFYLCDSNSTNGSFINSLPLAYRKSYKLNPMDRIKFASESYIFY